MLVMALLVLFFMLFLLYAILCKSTSKYAKTVRFPSEKEFFDKTSDEKKKFPSLYDKATCQLSVIVPAYNEEARLPSMLDDCIKYLEDRCKKTKSFSYEVIIIDDGSTDKTSEVALAYSARLGSDKFRVLTLEKNRGKGGAVRLGVLSSRGKYILFADADGATFFPDLEKVEECMEDLLKRQVNGKSDVAIVCGSRAHLEQEAIATRSSLRNLLMHGFHALVWIFTVRTVRDTQCGFKLFTRKAAQMTFPSLHIERWAFDVELLFLAEKMNVPIGEVAVTWTEIEGSKVVPVFSWLQMGRDLILIWLRYTLGAWAAIDESTTKSK